ncbi:MAG: FkbM family methyltransferase, partial [Kiritimatiellaeota bacterium]|nr:FkbM family methyltransferase [Kiritimatiellota bacterium]
GLRATSDESAIAFYTHNAERVTGVANMLCDERSRREYLAIIAFRQSYRKRDYPLCDWKSPEYFIKEMTFGDDELFIDCGAYVGDTVDAFLKHCPTYRHIVAFEPDTGNFAKLKQKHGDDSRITLFNEGVYDTEGEVRFSAIGTECSAINDVSENTVAISVKTLDGLNLNNVSFIKMDIEGAELKALKGAEKTILRDKPKLAICIYHSKEDMIDIAEYIHALVPEYRLYIRHHNRWPLWQDTVLYAQMP